MYEKTPILRMIINCKCFLRKYFISILNDKSSDGGFMALSKAHIVYFIVLTLLLCSPFIVNGYPILFYDSATYATSFRGLHDMDIVPYRPIFYSVYIWATQLFGHTLIFVPITQAILLAWLI